jgi:hypothetical protein
MRSVSSSTRSALLMMGLCLPLALHAQSTGFSGTAALSSQLFDRGQAVTRNTPILQGAASWTFPAGWTLGVSGSSELRSPGHVVEALIQASRDWSLSGDWRAQTSLLYYTYDGNARANAFDRTEAGLHWTYRDVLTFGLSAIYVIGAKGHRPRGAADLSLHWPLAWHFSLSAGAGVAQSSITPYNPYTPYTPYIPYTPYRYGQSDSYDYDRASPYGHVRAGLYGYGHAGLLWSNGPWRVELDRIVADHGAQRQWNDLRASPWVATISRSF